jgi:UDP-N-acetylglucosamine--N-acetylmuramyl-(pentapeptide) pyrophosphoryl-undecaprenol N-acetylglucosamine transferase
LENVREIYARADIRAELQSFFTDLPVRMAAAHLVIGRAGAGTVSELMAIGRPAILVPLPYALDDNQTPNADILADAGAGWRVREAELTPEFLARMLSAIFADPKDLAARAAKAHALATPDAAARLADLVERLAAGERRGA